jgi:hypothetical protein
MSKRKSEVSLKKIISSVEHSEAEVNGDGLNAAEFNRAIFGILRKMGCQLVGSIRWLGAGESE